MADSYVYLLLRQTGEPFYVGKGRGDRWLEHERWAKRGRSHKDNIIVQMQDRGLTVPKIKIAAGLSDLEAFALEIRMIALIGRVCDGGPLTNLTRGGDGVVDLSPEAKARHRENMTKAQTGKAHTPERCKAASDRSRGRRFGPPQTPETAAKRSESLRRYWAAVPPDQRSNRGNKGRKFSDETRRKMSEAALRRIARKGKVIG